METKVERRKRLRRGYSLDYYYRNRRIVNERNRKRARDCLKSWEGLLPSVTYCQICDKEIFYNRNNAKRAIHFDHRNGAGATGYRVPMNWLEKHKRNPKNEKIWKSFDFGMLCLSCNSHLPTENRKDYLKNVIEYVFGEENL